LNLLLDAADYEYRVMHFTHRYQNPTDQNRRTENLSNRPNQQERKKRDQSFVLSKNSLGR
ncbi:hypothetical protein, partial [Vibrio cholerae]